MACGAVVAVASRDRVSPSMTLWALFSAREVSQRSLDYGPPAMHHNASSSQPPLESRAVAGGGEHRSRASGDPRPSASNGSAPSSSSAQSTSNSVPPQAILMEMDRQKVTPTLINYIEHFTFPFINDVGKYEKMLKIGQGTFGEVFKARCKHTGRLVALKKILMENEKEGFPITALREVKMLQRLKDKHITELIEICSSKPTSYNRERSTFYLVFAFCEHDLAGLLSNTHVQLRLQDIKTLMKHLLSGLFKIHSSKILHRDMKAANVLITKDGILKLADFGLARPLFKAVPNQPEHCYTNRVVTLWYRPPELLLGERHYGPAIDIWGAGCIMAELWTRSPILQGDTEQKQLMLISNLCGSINPSTWKGVDKLPMYGSLELPQNLPRRVVERLEGYIKDAHALDLIDSLLRLDPSRRPDANTALDHDFFFSDPMPGDDVKQLMSGIQHSLFEYTAGRGAHSNRGRGAAGAAGGTAPGGRGGTNRTGVVAQGQLFDRVF